ncbi:hypothetical protein [Spirosoma telluris]
MEAELTFRLATANDLITIIYLLADDALGLLVKISNSLSQRTM